MQKVLPGIQKKVFISLICLLPFSNFIFNKVDIWHAHGQFFQLGILALLFGSLIEKHNIVNIKNKSLAYLILWMGLVTANIWYQMIIAVKHYAIVIFFPFFNFLCFILFYKFSIEYLDKESIEKIFKWLGKGVFIILCYCILQKLNLDQFYNPLSPVFPDELVGTIGNTSHLAGYLALCQPLYFKKGWFNYIALILVWIVLGLTLSASGIFTAIWVVFFWLLIRGEYKWFSAGIIFSLAGLRIITLRFPDFFTFSHRLEVWQLLFEKFKTKPITGYGLGAINTFNIQLGGQWRHVHQEYYQVMIELGIIGLALLLWCIFDYFRILRTIRTDLTIKIASIFFGFCLLGIFTFPGHLWLLANMGMIGYSFLYVIKNEVNNGS